VTASTLRCLVVGWRGGDQRRTQWWALSWALGISIVFALYFAFLEINERMGEGELWRLFFESPKAATNSADLRILVRATVKDEAVALDAADQGSLDVTDNARTWPAIMSLANIN
jgi:Na+/melibiose symporter-like transporter